MTVNTRFIYTPIENGRRRTGGWSQTRAWQERGDGQEAKRAVMVHEMRATDKKLDLLVARIFDEARRIFFKVSNLPEAGRSTPCLERHYKQTQEDGNVYHIITKGWHGNTLGDLFGENGSLKAIGTSFRAEFRRPGRRAEFWQALTPIVKLLQHMQEAKLFLPGLDLDSLCFCADDENEYLEQQAGHFSFDSLRLVGLERILPFGTRLGNAHLDAASPMNMAPVQILTWRSLAGVIIDALLGPPPAAWSDEKKHDYRTSEIESKMRNGHLTLDEYEVLSRMLHACDDFGLGNVYTAFERLCYNLPLKGTQAGQTPRLTIVYNYVQEGIPALVDGNEFGHDPTHTQVDEYLVEKFKNATVWFKPEESHSNEPMTLYFECGPGLWFKGQAYWDRDTEQYDTRIIFLHGQTGPLEYHKKYVLTSVNLLNTRLRCFSLQEQKHKTHDGRDWVPELKNRITHARYEKIRDERLAILSTLEMTNQLESLMAFLNLFVCQVEEVKADNQKVTVSLVPLEDEMVARAPHDCMERLTKVRQIQDGIRDIIGHRGTYREYMHRYLRDQHDQHVFLPEEQRCHEDLLLTDWQSAGSLSVNIGSGSRNLNAISWKMDWELFSGQGKIEVSRSVLLDAKERRILCQGELVSVRTRGHYGQMEVIKRRTDAFEHLGKYDMLMQQLVKPDRITGEFAPDSGRFRKEAEATLNQDVCDPDKKLDDNKMAVIEDAFKTMPLFVLQGPAGTGKSETVCSLAKLIFTEDPMIQMLMTSRENATVKELWSKLRGQSRDWPSRPLFRLSRKIQNSLLVRDNDQDDAERHDFAVTVEEQVAELLEQAREKRIDYGDDVRLGELCASWNAFLDAYARQPGPAESGSHVQAAHDVSVPWAAERESIGCLLEQSANFVFTTASDKALADMVDEGHMYDRAFVEEAGKTPFYDLILPMLVSQRWVLLGDPQQLKPFQSREFTLLMDKYHDVVKLLQDIKELGQSGRKDYISLKNIELAMERKDARYFERSWIEPFRKMFEDIGSSDLDRTEANGQTSAMLNVVYRLPPVVTELLNVFYSIDLKPADMTRNPSAGRFAPSSNKSNPLVAPACLTRANAIWLNTQSRMDFCHNIKDMQSWNPGEAKLISRLLSQCRTDGAKPSLAILTPYKKQVGELKSHLKGLELSNYFTPAVLKGRKREWVSTIDAFQGCQADVVVVSLVRCRTAGQEENKESIAFVAEENRSNVMISRAQKLLLIVGSLDYFKACYASEPDSSEDRFRAFLQRYQELARDSESRDHLTIVDYDQVSVPHEKACGRRGFSSVSSQAGGKP